MPWFDCHVEFAGVGAIGDVYVGLDDTGDAFPRRSFIATDAVKREMLATALSAIASGKRVGVDLESTNEHARIIYIHVNKG